MNSKYIVLLEAPNQKPTTLDGIHHSLTSAVVSAEKYNIIAGEGFESANQSVAFVYKQIFYSIKEDGQ